MMTMRTQLGALALVAAGSLAAQTQFNISTIAGGAPAPTPQAALNASFGQPQGIAVDKAGNIYIADAANHVVRQVTTDGVIHTFAGNGTAGNAGDGGPANDAGNAQLYRPVALAIDGSGNVYIADAASFVVRKVTTDGNIATFAGTGDPGYSGDGGAATSANMA